MSDENNPFASTSETTNEASNPFASTNSAEANPWGNAERSSEEVTQSET
ncbi:hypothetical protein [Oceanospirillum beijerinckii]|nr:hypothetical protein [Oceanospirillum beijerinckii]